MSRQLLLFHCRHYKQQESLVDAQVSECQHSAIIHTPSREKPDNINVIYTSMKSTLGGLQFCRWYYGSTPLKAAKSREIQG